MKEFKKISAEELNENFIDLIGNKWMLITAGKGESVNTMTASWGGVGELWNKNVAFTFIRPTRYTYEFVENNELCTLSFFDEEYREQCHMTFSSSEGVLLYSEGEKMASA